MPNNARLITNNKAHPHNQGAATAPPASGKIGIGVGVIVGSGTAVGVGCGTGVAVGIAVGVAVGVKVGVGVGVIPAATGATHINPHPPSNANKTRMNRYLNIRVVDPIRYFLSSPFPAKPGLQ